MNTKHLSRHHRGRLKRDARKRARLRATGTSTWVYWGLRGAFHARLLRAHVARLVDELLPEAP